MNERGPAAGRPDATSAPALTLSLVIPAYNEEARLSDGVGRLSAAIAAGALAPESTEFIVVDDGSTDDTSERAGALFSAFPHVQLLRLPENHGKGGAVRAGVAVASAPVIAFADADMAIDPAQAPQFLAAMARADLAIGSRAASGASVDRTSLHRSLMNRAFNRLVNALTNVALDDTQCGFKAFRAPVAKLLFHCSVTERFAFDVEILSLARRFGLVIDEVPVQWLRVQGSQIRPWTDARSMAGDVIRTRRRAGSGTPVPALTLQWEDEADADACASALAGPGVLPVGLPLFRQGAGSVVVLCPLASDADVDEAAGRMAARCPGGTLARTAMTVAQLSAGAPLSLLWSGAGMAPDTAVRPPH